MKCAFTWLCVPLVGALLKLPIPDDIAVPSLVVPHGCVFSWLPTCLAPVIFRCAIDWWEPRQT